MFLKMVLVRCSFHGLRFSLDVIPSTFRTGTTWQRKAVTQPIDAWNVFLSSRGLRVLQRIAQTQPWRGPNINQLEYPEALRAWHPNIGTGYNFSIRLTRSKRQKPPKHQPAPDQKTLSPQNTPRTPTHMQPSLELSCNSFTTISHAEPSSSFHGQYSQTSSVPSRP